MVRTKQRIRRKYIRFTQRDGLTVQAIFRARYLTNVHVRDLFYKPTTYSWCKQRLRYLYDKGYVTYRQASMSEPYVYYLALKGKRYVASHCTDWTYEQIAKIAGVRAKSEMVSDLMIRHDLVLSDLYVAAQGQCWEHGWDLAWENARMLELRRLGVQPDAYLRIEKGERVLRKAFVEFTSAMPVYKEMKSKLAKYEPAIDKVPDAVVLWLTTSQAKMEKLYRWTKDYRYREWIVFGLMEDQGHFLDEQVWIRHGSERRVGLIAPEEWSGGQAAPDSPSLDQVGG